MNLKQAKELVRSRLSDKRYEHTINVKKMAVKLAKHYGADEEQAALAALLRISGDSFTPESIRDTLTGCGAVCQVEEGEPGYVTVSFPGIPGIPAGFAQMKRIIEDILPAHVLAQYTFWYITWTELETKLPTWQAIEALELTWTRLETYVT